MYLVSVPLADAVPIKRTKTIIGENENIRMHILGYISCFRRLSGLLILSISKISRVCNQYIAVRLLND